jgi:hypothetical protein
VLHAFKLGPIEVGRDRVNVYAAVGENGISRPAFAKSDAKGLRELADAARGEALRCEPVLAATGKKLGFVPGPLPTEALVARAGLAVALTLGPMGGGGDASAVIRLLEAFAAFWRARPWERFNGDDPLPVTLAAAGRLVGREASVMGMGGEQFGIALYEKPGSVRRVGDLVEAGRFAEAHKVAGVAVTIDPEPEYAVRAVEEAYAIPGVPIPLAVGKSKARACSSEEILALAAALEAVAQLMPARREGRAVAEAGPSRCEARVTVTGDPMRQEGQEVGAPVAASAPAPSRARTPRNAPCPCGSGKKYKKCHLAEDEAAESSGRSPDDEARRLAERDPFHALDGRMVDEILGLARQRWGKKFDPGGALAELGLDERSAQLLVPWCVCHYDAPDGRTALDLLDLGDRGPLSAEERDWRDAQRVACFSVLEVTWVKPGEGVGVRDLLTGDQHLVREVSGSRTLVARDVILARVAEYRGKAFFCGMHSRSLPPRAGAAVVRGLKSELGVRTKRAPRDDLRVAADEGVLFVAWEAAVAELDRRPPPKLANTDGDPLLLTTDHFTVSSGAEIEVRKRLLALPGVQADGDAPGDLRVTFTKPGNAMHKSWETTIMGSATLGEAGLRVEANSVARADRLRALVEKACVGQLAFRAREHSDPAALLRNSTKPAAPSAPEDPDVAAELADLKARHYRDWLDERIPALGGLTPRQAAKRSGKPRRELELVLAEMEHGEARLPAKERFDVSELRRELGLPEP